MNPRRLDRLVEFLLLFGAVPLVLRYGVPEIHPLVLLWAATLACLTLLLRSADFDRRELWNAQNLRRRAFLALVPFVLAAPLIALGTLVLLPQNTFRLVRERPLVWAAVMLLYPLLSVYPQGLVYRVFLSHRYRPLFPSPAVRIVASALAFAMAHIVFRNWIAPTLSFVGGMVFAWTFEETRSSLIAGLQHAIFGCWLFTTGLGWFFYYGAMVGAGP